MAGNVYTHRQSFGRIDITSCNTEIIELNLEACCALISVLLKDNVSVEATIQNV